MGRERRPVVVSYGLVRHGCGRRDGHVAVQLSLRGLRRRRDLAAVEAPGDVPLVRHRGPVAGRGHHACDVVLSRAVPPRQPREPPNLHTGTRRMPLPDLQSRRRLRSGNRGDDVRRVPDAVDAPAARERHADSADRSLAVPNRRGRRPRTAANVVAPATRLRRSLTAPDSPGLSWRVMCRTGNSPSI